MAEIITDQTGMKHEVASNTKANVGVSLGAVGTGLGVMAALGGGLLAGMKGCYGGRTSESIYNERKENADFVAITKQYYEGKIAENDRMDKAFFDLYKFNVDNSFGLYKNHIDDAFKLYKQERDDKDALNEKISKLQSKVDVMAAIRPYQDALINAKMDKNAILADFNLSRRTCRMIEGQLVLPSTPEITGYGSHHE